MAVLRFGSTGRRLPIYKDREVSLPLSFKESLRRLGFARAKVLAILSKLLYLLAKSLLRLAGVTSYRFGFVRSGNVSVYNGNTYWNGSINGYDWSRAALAWGTVTYPGTDSRAGNLNFNGAVAAGTSVNPSNTNQRFNGFALRCLRVCPWFGADLWTFVKFLYIPHQVSNYIPSQKYQIVV